MQLDTLFLWGLGRQCVPRCQLHGTLPEAPVFQVPGRAGDRTNADPLPEDGSEGSSSLYAVEGRRKLVKGDGFAVAEVRKEKRNMGNYPNPCHAGKSSLG